jgi:hypothetical protein
MRAGAHVNSIEALEHFRAALCVFGDEVGQSLATIQSEIQDFVTWLEHDQMLLWRKEVRLREDKVGEAKTDLHRCLAATIDANRTPSCYQEKKALDIAKHRLQEAEASLAAVRRWIPIVRQAVLEYGLKVEPLRSAVAADLPLATAFLGASVSRLVEYLRVAAPTAAPVAAKRDATEATASPSIALPACERAARQDDTAAPVVAPADARSTDSDQGVPPSSNAGRES